MKKLPFYKDDVALGMQTMNIGITDSVITEYEYSMLDAFNKDEDTKNLMLITSVRRLGWDTKPNTIRITLLGFIAFNPTYIFIKIG